MKNIVPNPSRVEIEKILKENNLPTDDLSDMNLDNFLAYAEDGNTKGVVGLEAYGAEGLLRSLAVSVGYQGSGCGSVLLGALENHARAIGIKQLYLLTETAAQYFTQRGFLVIPRALASDSIQSTQQFSELCPANAVLMRKQL